MWSLPKASSTYFLQAHAISERTSSAMAVQSPPMDDFGAAVAMRNGAKARGAPIRRRREIVTAEAILAPIPGFNDVLASPRKKCAKELPRLHPDRPVPASGV